MRATSVSQVLIILICGLILLTFSACGNQFHSEREGSNTPTSTTTTQMKNTAQAHLTATPGKVTVIQDKLHYGVQEVITVRIMNGLMQAVYVSTYHTDCTPVILEKQTDTTWVPQGSCLKTQGVPAPFMQVKPGSIIQQELKPFSGTAGHLLDTWQPGTYRITISYTTTFDPDSLQGGTLVRSQTFTIG